MKVLRPAILIAHVLASSILASKDGSKDNPFRCSTRWAFLLYINDISNHIHSPLRLFADNYLLYRVINTKQDALQLQQDLNVLSNWAETWQLKFNISKCTIMRFTRSISPLTFNYQLSNIALSSADQHLYLGVLLDRKLSWSPHISRITSKATRTLNFIKRNLSNCSTDVKAAAYLSMVRPLMEYAAAVWDPHHVGDTQELEKVQRRAARWALNDYIVDIVRFHQC